MKHKVVFTDGKTRLFCGNREVDSVDGDANFSMKPCRCGYDVDTTGTIGKKMIYEARTYPSEAK